MTPTVDLEVIGHRGPVAVTALQRRRQGRRWLGDSGIDPSLARPLQLELDGPGYTVRADVKLLSGTTARIRLHNDARLEVE